MRHFYVIGKIVKYDEEKLELILETLISPLHRPSERVHVRIKEEAKSSVREGAIIIAKVSAMKRLIVYDIKRLEAYEIHTVTGQVLEELAEEITHSIKTSRYEIPIK